jgi:CHASE1-domain containing sensor protein
MSVFAILWYAWLVLVLAGFGLALLGIALIQSRHLGRERKRRWACSICRAGISRESHP